MKHPIPISILDAHLAVLGKTGAGKSYALRGLIEMLLESKRRVCIIDPKGDHWGIKSSHDGKKPGYAVVIFGGDHADVPMSPRNGKEIAELVATGNRPCVIDFRGWMPGDRTRFWIDFASTLFRMNKSPLWLVMDEVHNFAPQGKVVDPDAGKSLHWTNRIGTEGRGMGLHVLMASQRPQKVHKDMLTCAETLIAMRVVHPLDRNAMKEWIDGCGDADRGKMVLNSLAEMKRGEAFVWSPEIGFFERQEAPPSGWAEVNLDEVKKRLAATIEEAKANDPDLLKKRIRELELKLRMNRPQVDESAVSRAMERAKAEAARENADRIKTLESAIARQQGTMRKAAEMLAGAAVNVPRFVPVSVRVDGVQDLPIPPRQMINSGHHTSGEGKVDNRILDTIAMLNTRGIDVTREAVARWMGIHPAGGRYIKSLAMLRSQGLLDGWALTAEGFAMASPGKTGLETAIAAVKEGSGKRILETIASVDGPLSREELAERLGIHPAGGRFIKNLAWLRDMGLIPERGPIGLTKGARA
jgi:hypothetical protein